MDSMRVEVDGTTHPIHEKATGVRVLLTYATGEVAEVQVARAGYGLRVVLAGEAAELAPDQHGFLATTLYPTEKEESRG